MGELVNPPEEERRLELEVRMDLGEVEEDKESNPLLGVVGVALADVVGGVVVAVADVDTDETSRVGTGEVLVASFLLKICVNQLMLCASEGGEGGQIPIPRLKDPLGPNEVRQECDT
jgi:hypothetical protein